MPLPVRRYPPALVYQEDWEIDARLVPFGTKRAEWVEVARTVVGARADAVDNDPLSAAGQFAYIFGTRSTRALLRPKKWIIYREENIEAVRHPERDLKIVYQSVDLAASLDHDPKAVSGKGEGADRLISTAQGSLFTPEQLTGGTSSKWKPMNSGVWFFCVSVNGDDVRAELSLPIRVSGNNFSGFVERIFIVRPGEWPTLSVTAPLPQHGPTEFEPVVTRKK